MGAFELIFRNVVVFVALALPGVILVKTKLLAVEQSVALSKLLIYVGLPFLIFKSTLELQFNKELLKIIIFSAVVGIALMFLGVLLSKPCSRMETDEKRKGILRFCLVFPNNGFLGIPLALAVFPDRPLVHTCLIMLNVITNTMAYVLGSRLIAAEKTKISVKKILTTPILVAFVLGIVGSLLKLPTRIPETLTYSQYLGGIVTPLSMLILGMKLGGIKFSSLFTNWKTYYVSACKLILFPIITVIVAFLTNLLFHTGEDFIWGMFVSFAMPTAAVATTFADSYNGDVENAVIFTLGTTVFSVVTIPIFYTILCALL